MPLTDAQPASPSLASLDIEVTILQGRDLVAKDRALFGLGKRKSSDPFVKVFLGGKYRGRTETIYKTLSPKWRKGRIKIKLHSSHDINAIMSGKDKSWSSLKLLVFDEDQLSENDDMGTVVIPLGPILTKRPETKWYPVGKGSGSHHCHNATGELQVKVSASGRKVLDLIRGNVVDVPGGRVRVGLGWELEGGRRRSGKRSNGGGGGGQYDNTAAETDLDLSCVAVDHAGSILMDESVYYANLENPNRTITHTGDERTGEEDLGGTGDDEVITCNLDLVPMNVLALYFIATVATPSKTFADVTSALVRVTDMQSRSPLCQIVPSQAGESTALFLFRVARNSKRRGWVLSVIGGAHDTARDFGALIPDIKCFTRDLVPHVEVNPFERVALMSKGGAIRVSDFAGVAKGEKMPSNLTFGLAWDVTNGVSIDLDASVICMDKNRDVVEVVYFKRLESTNGSIRHGGDERRGDKKGDDEEIFLSLDNILQEVEYIGFVINSYSGQELDDVSRASCHLFHTATLKDYARYTMTNCKMLDKHTALVLGCLYRDHSKGDWCLWIISKAAQGRTAKDNIYDFQRALEKGPPKPEVPPEIEEDIVFSPMPEPIPVDEADIEVLPMHEMEDIVVKFG